MQMNPTTYMVAFSKLCNTVGICKICAMYIFLPIDDPNYRCIKCKINELLEEKVKGLEASLATLRLNQQNKKLQLKEEDCSQTKHAEEQITKK